MVCGGNYTIMALLMIHKASDSPPLVAFALSDCGGNKRSNNEPEPYGDNHSSRVAYGLATDIRNYDAPEDHGKPSAEEKENTIIIFIVCLGSLVGPF